MAVPTAASRIDGIASSDVTFVNVIIRCCLVTPWVAWLERSSRIKPDINYEVQRYRGVAVEVPLPCGGVIIGFDRIHVRSRTTPFWAWFSAVSLCTGSRNRCYFNSALIKTRWCQSLDDEHCDILILSTPPKIMANSSETKFPYEVSLVMNITGLHPKDPCVTYNMRGYTHCYGTALSKIARGGR